MKHLKSFKLFESNYTPEEFVSELIKQLGKTFYLQSLNSLLTKFRHLFYFVKSFIFFVFVGFL